MIPKLAEAGISLGRISTFLDLPEVDSRCVERPGVDEAVEDYDDDVAVQVRGGSFRWWDAVPAKAADDDSGASDNTENDLADAPLLGGSESSASNASPTVAETSNGKPTLVDLDLTVRRGELVVVCGAVGAGKSALVAALLGELEKMTGSVMVRGSVAYSAQAAHILNATVAENICFGLPRDDERLDEAVRLAALDHDLEVLGHGVETDIGGAILFENESLLLVVVAKGG